MVGAVGRKVLLAGKVKWSRQAMSHSVLADLHNFKLPALRQAGVDVDSAQILLFSRAGFTGQLQSEAASPGVRLVDLNELTAR